MAVALIFVVAGAAFACTKYYGKITGSGNGTGNDATTVTGDPRTDFFQWCENPPEFSGTSDATREAFWSTTVSGGTAPSLTVTVAPETVNCLQTVTGTNRLPTLSTYKVGISEGYWDETDQGFATGDEDNCHTLETSSGVGYGTIIDWDFNVDSSGNGSETFSDANGHDFNANLRDAVSGAGGWNTVCVYWPEGATLPSGDTVYWNPANALNFRSL